MRTRYVEYDKFSEMICRLHRQAQPDHVGVLFNSLSQTIDVGGIIQSVVDLKAFLLLLKLAGTDSRRSFDDKSSKTAYEVSNICLHLFMCLSDY
jgi:hypothetical protein